MFHSEASREISPGPSGDSGYDGETQTSRNRSDDQKTPVLGRAATFGGLVTSTSRKSQSREQSSKIFIHPDLEDEPDLDEAVHDGYRPLPKVASSSSRTNA